MDYIRISIKINPFEEWIRDMLTSQLAETGFESFLEAESGFDAYIDANFFNEKNLNNLLEKFPDEYKFLINKELIPSQNWNREWEINHFKPILIGEECLVRGPSHSGFPHKPFDIIIEPNMAFGTGTHETTSMMMEVMLSENLAEKSVLDMGCGTGILGILAAKKNAGNITAIDIDEKAVKSTQRNAELNNTHNINAMTGDISLVKNEHFDIIIANIYKNVLLNYLPAFTKILNDRGKLFISGFFVEDAGRLRHEAEKAGLTEISLITKNNWAVLIFSKSPDPGKK
ncbi:MAG: 50S ribosomal protein L11 methyltransferase [Prolixibacteraceae bacterium]|nr:50S ribosomal protein L11 methyltransferase [Prolixibacteraceae bacterium]